MRYHKSNGQYPIPSFGLLVMSERAERIGAKLTIQSSPGEGTEVTVLVNPE